MSEPFSPLIGGKWALPIAGVIGAFLSLAFVKHLKPLPAILSVVGGAATAAYAGPIIVAWAGLSGHGEEFVGFIIGFTGMNLLGGLCSISQRFRTDPIGMLKQMRGANERRDDP